MMKWSQWKDPRFFGACMVLVFMLGGLALADCPEVCTCKWKGGKQTVECINASLSNIPNIEAGTQVLDLGINYFPALRTDTFRRANLTNLQKIYLHQCSLRLLEVHTFRGLTNLVDLDLSGNALTSVPSPAVADCKYLMRLSLRSNPISSVGDEAFRGLHELVHLDLSQCGLEQVHPFAFRGLDSLEYLRLEANRLTTLSPAQSFPPNLRDLTLHQNRWHCDCHLLALHNWLQNFTVPNSVEPRCHSPPRLISEPIKNLSPLEFACIPKVSPTSMYLEVIEGKNMSLVCSIEAIPEAVVSWKYKETEINNGSTLVNDIDMRQYYYVNTATGTGKRKSELFLSATSVDDNGTFSCFAQNKAGKAKAEFTLHVVVPMPPKPPQDVLEERFRTEYLIAIVVAVGLLLIISLVVTTLLALRCQRSRAKRLRAAAIESSELQRSRSGGDLSNDTVATQMTPATSYAGSANGSAVVAVLPPGTGGVGPQNLSSTGVTTTDLLLLQENPDLLKQLGNGSIHSGKHGSSVDDEIRLGLLNATCNAVANKQKQQQMILTQNHHQEQQQRKVLVVDDSDTPSPPPLLPKRSTSYDIFKTKQENQNNKIPNLSPPTPFADDSFGVPMPHIMSKTLPRRLPAGLASSMGGNGMGDPLGAVASRGNDTRGRKSLTTEVAIPPPPQYKGVHFAPQVVERRRSSSEAAEAGAASGAACGAGAAHAGIPVEGLPTRPAGSNSNSNGSNGFAGQQHPKAETVAIQVRNNPVPLLSAIMKSSASGSREASHSGISGNISSFEHKKQPPQPPPKTSTLTSKHVMGVRDKALAASAAGCEIVFVSPDEGFNEEVLTSNSAVSASAQASTASKGQEER